MIINKTLPTTTSFTRGNAPFLLKYREYIFPTELRKQCGSCQGVGSNRQPQHHCGAIQ